MAHPKHRTSKQRRNKRRTHDAITVTAIAKCSNCGAAVQYHTVCPECGYSANVEAAPSIIENENKIPKEELKEVATPGTGTIEELCEF